MYTTKFDRLQEAHDDNAGVNLVSNVECLLSDSPYTFLRERDEHSALHDM